MISEFDPQSDLWHTFATYNGLYRTRKLLGFGETRMESWTCCIELMCDEAIQQATTAIQKNAEETDRVIESLIKKGVI